MLIPADPVPLARLPVGRFFAFDTEPGIVYRIVYPKGGDPANIPTDSTVWYGIAYQPTVDGNSVYAVNMQSGLLWRMKASLVARPVSNVRVVMDLTQ